MYGQNIIFSSSCISSIIEAKIKYIVLLKKLCILKNFDILVLIVYKVRTILNHKSSKIVIVVYVKID